MEWNYRVQRFVIWLMAKSYFRFRAQGDENVPSSGPVLLAANHCSFLDPPLIAAGLSRQVTFLAKEELFSIPLFGWWIKQLGAYPVSRGQGDSAAMKKALRFLKEGKALLIFPEGTRSLDGTLQPFEEGISWLSLQSRAPVVPVLLKGTFEALPKGKIIPKPERISMHVGKPVHLASDQPVENNRELLKPMTRRLEQIFHQLLNQESAMGFSG